MDSKLFSLPSYLNVPKVEIPSTDIATTAAKTRLAKYDAELNELRDTIDRTRTEMQLTERTIESKELLFNLGEVDGSEIAELYATLESLAESLAAAKEELEKKTPSRKILETRIQQAQSNLTGREYRLLYSDYIEQHEVALSAFKTAHEQMLLLLPLHKASANCFDREMKQQGKSSYISYFGANTEVMYTELREFFEKAGQFSERLQKIISSGGE